LLLLLQRLALCSGLYFVEPPFFPARHRHTEKLMEGSTSAQGTRAAARQRTRELVESALDTRSLPGLPSSYAFHPHQPLLYFIGRREGDKSSSLYFTTLPSPSSAVPVEGLHKEEGQWQPLLQAPTTSGQEKLSKEEEVPPPPSLTHKPLWC
jgi:hypothetical protein